MGVERRVIGAIRCNRCGGTARDPQEYDYEQNKKDPVHVKC